MIACMFCGGLEYVLIGALLTVLPFIGSLYHKIKHKCCKKECECDCHNEHEKSE